MADRPKKSITTPTPYCPVFTASGTPKDRSVMLPMFPPELRSSAHPFSHP